MPRTKTAERAVDEAPKRRRWRPRKSEIKPQDATSTTRTTSDTSERIDGPQRARKGPKKAIPKVGLTDSSNSPRSNPSGPSKTETPESPQNLQPQRVVIDAVSGEILGPDKSLDLETIPETKYSHSFLKTIGQCTAAAYFRRSKAPSKAVFAMEQGSAAHHLIEIYEKEHKDPLKHLAEAWQRFIVANRDNMTPKDQEQADKGPGLLEQIMTEFVYENEEILDRIRPEDVEVPFTILVTINTAKGPMKRYVTGKIDLVLWNRERTEYEIIDWKSSSKAPSKDELTQEPQFFIYAKAATELYGFPPVRMSFYLLRGEHLCSERFSSKAHPRLPIKSRLKTCEINYAFEVPVPNEEQIQSMLDTYYGSQIWKWESGIIGRDGKADYRNRCERCQYKEACDNFKGPFEAPVFVR